MSDKGKVLIGLAVVIIGLISVFWSGFVASVLWNWFVVPLGVASISFAHATGILLLVKLCTAGYKGNSEESTKESATRILVYFAAPAILLLFGFIAKGFM